MYTFKRLITILGFFLNVYPTEGQQKPQLEIGGALRFNYNYSTWKKEQRQRGGDFGYDVFYVDVNAKYKGLKMQSEYRLYSKSFGGGFLKRGWIGYDFNENNDIQIGLTKVPFGIANNSHNWFFGLNYYLGYEDDHDMGIKYTHKGTDWEYSLGFFKNAEELDFGDNSDVSNSRYAYDVGTLSSENGTLSYRNKEVNQLDGRIIYILSNTELSQKLGASLQYGGLYNLNTRRMGCHYAFAFHYELEVKKWDFKAQITKYQYLPESPIGESNDVIALTAYGAPYLAASKAFLYTLASGYSIPLDWGPVKNLTLYDDFGFMDKAQDSFSNTYMNVTGAMIAAGDIIVYLDIAAGKNHPWLGPDWTGGLGAGEPDASWSARCNLNIGYYF